MKKTSILIGMMALGFFATAQTRMSLYEEFTGENCGPCAATNPGLVTLLAANATKVIPIKWQVPIPSAPSNTWSIYQQAKNFIDWRWRPASSGGYGYLCATCSPTAAYVNYAPHGRMDGQELNAFGINAGGNTNHPGNLTAAAISSAQAQSTPFSINFANPIWDNTFSTATVVATVTSSAIFNAAGTLKFRLVLVERVVNFPTAPGSNGEKDFYDIVRYCYNTTPAVPSTTISDFGIVLQSAWAAASSTILTWTCTVPASVYDKGQMAFVGFVQDDIVSTSGQKVWQAARTIQPSIPNDAKAMSVATGGAFTCSATITPSATIKNNGSNAITAMTITPYMNSVTGTPVQWTGNLASGATISIPMGTENTANGTNVYSVTVTGVSGGDVVMSNNGTSGSFINTNTYNTAPVAEGFVNPTFPPPGWGTVNTPNAQYAWERSTAAGGFGTSSESSRIFINWTPTGQTQEMYMPGQNFTGTVNPSCKFDLSYTMLNSSSTDKLELQVSTNCGATWTNAWMNSGPSMSTTPNNSVSLNIPTASQWSLVTVSLLSYSSSANVMVRFRATGGGGNVIWVDNINLYDAGSVGLNNKSNALNEFDVYPNPAANDVNVKITAANAQNSTIKVLNNLGQVVITKNVSVSAGSNIINIDTKNLANGIYYVNYDSGNGTVTKKLTITK
jgi:hypothetical protein